MKISFYSIHSIIRAFNIKFIFFIFDITISCLSRDFQKIWLFSLQRWFISDPRSISILYWTCSIWSKLRCSLCLMVIRSRIMQHCPCLFYLSIRTLQISFCWTYWSMRIPRGYCLENFTKKIYLVNVLRDWTPLLLTGRNHLCSRASLPVSLFVGSPSISFLTRSLQFWVLVSQYFGLNEYSQFLFSFNTADLSAPTKGDLPDILWKGWINFSPIITNSYIVKRMTPREKISICVSYVSAMRTSGAT